MMIFRGKPLDSWYSQNSKGMEGRVPLRSLKLVATNMPGQPLDSAVGESGGFHENTDGKWSLMLMVKK